VYVPSANPVKLKAPEVFAVVVVLAAPLKAIVAPPPPAAGVIAPEMLYVCACVLFAVFCPLTIPAHPQRRIIGRSVAAKITATRVREFMLCGFAMLDRPSHFRSILIVQAPQDLCWTQEYVYSCPLETASKSNLSTGVTLSARPIRIWRSRHWPTQTTPRQAKETLLKGGRKNTMLLSARFNSERLIFPQAGLFNFTVWV
jgi:hypothetical protein